MSTSFAGLFCNKHHFKGCFSRAVGQANAEKIHEREKELKYEQREREREANGKKDDSDDDGIDIDAILAEQNGMPEKKKIVSNKYQTTIFIVTIQNDQELDGVEKEPLAGRGLAAALRVAFQKGYVDGKLATKVDKQQLVLYQTNLSLAASQLTENIRSEFRLKAICTKIKTVWTI